MRVAVLDDWFDTLRHLPCYDLLAGHEVTIFTDHEPDPARLAKRLEPFEAITLFRERTAITADLLRALPNLRLISQRSAYPHVDVEACTAQGVLLCSRMGGGAPPHAAAEHTFALILAAMRQLPQQMQSLRAGGWQIGVGKTLNGRRLGLYGYGRIAKLVAGYGRAFGMEVLCWGSEAGRARAAAEGLHVPESREAFFATCDVVSIHVRLTPETRGLITAQDLAAMQPSALFVNTARAGLVETGALRAALDTGRPGSAALDVFDTEPITWAEDPLASHPRVTATPHLGFVTEDELNVQFTDIFSQVAAYASGAPENMINPEVWPQKDAPR